MNLLWYNIHFGQFALSNNKLNANNNYLCSSGIIKIILTIFQTLVGKFNRYQSSVITPNRGYSYHFNACIIVTDPFILGELIMIL